MLMQFELTQWWYLCGRIRAQFGLVRGVRALTFKSTSWSTFVLQGRVREVLKPSHTSTANGNGRARL